MNLLFLVIMCSFSFYLFVLFFHLLFFSWYIRCCWQQFRTCHWSPPYSVCLTYTIAILLFSILNSNIRFQFQFDWRLSKRKKPNEAWSWHINLLVLYGNLKIIFVSNCLSWLFLYGMNVQISSPCRDKHTQTQISKKKKTAIDVGIQYSRLNPYK